jgi:menaquinone-9 beta-reductase
MLDVLIAGAGPAGSMAAIVLARAGARVLLVDRETFPRDKLCGDTLNPGALRALASLRLTLPASAGRPLSGMTLSGPSAIVRASYEDAAGFAVRRRVLDLWLLEEAMRSGARFEPQLTARHPLVDASGSRPLVKGAAFTRSGTGEPQIRLPATITIAADGRGSALGRAAGLVSHPRRPRRWAYGTYMSGIDGVGTMGEMHIRSGGYIGIAPIDDGVANVCVVTARKPIARNPVDVIRSVVDRDRRLRARFRLAAMVAPVTVLGPLAVNATAPGVEGLLLAGDAAGFVDPMTGDGLNLAMRGGMLAAREALRALETGAFADAVARLAAARRLELGSKLRFNRFVRRLVSSPAAVELACWGSRIAPAIVRRAVRYAGDV